MTTISVPLVAIAASVINILLALYQHHENISLPSSIYLVPVLIVFVTMAIRIGIFLYKNWHYVMLFHKIMKNFRSDSGVNSLSSLMFMLTPPPAPAPVRQDDMTIMDTMATITYKYQGKNYTIQVPFDQKRVLDMSTIQVTLHRDEETTVDITHQPGMPYLLTAMHYGGRSITVTNKISGLVYDYGTKPPLYCQEVYYSE